MRMGIMQGRMVGPEDGRFQSFPRAHWEAEFDFAAKAGLDCIEWIFDRYGEDVNPISTDSGIQRLRALTKATGVGVYSICADWFMDLPLVRTTPEELEHRLKVLDWLLRRSAELGVGRVVLPFVDISRMNSEEEINQVVRGLEQVLPSAEATGVEIHLETTLSPQGFSELLARLPSPWIKVNYDSGNSASLGFEPTEEFSAYGPRIGSIHIKDRVRGGGTVPLGQGNTQFRALFEAVREVGYGGDFILQVARGETGDEVEWAKLNRRFVLDGLARTGGAAK